MINLISVGISEKRSIVIYKATMENNPLVMGFRRSLYLGFNSKKSVNWKIILYFRTMISKEIIRKVKKHTHLSLISPKVRYKNKTILTG